MNRDNELEKILESIKNKDYTVEHETTPIDLPPPKPKTEFEFKETPKEAAPVEEKPVTEETLTKEAPKEETDGFNIMELAGFSETEKEEEPIKEEPVKKEKPAKKEKPVKEKKPKSPEKKKTVAIFSAVAAAWVLIALGFVLFFSGSNLYVKKYEKKYNMPFPKGIPHEFCDLYGQNPTLAGSLDIDGKETLLYGKPDGGGALFEKGSDINADQHYRAAALEVSDADLETLYGTGEAYTSSSQSFTFKTIHGEKQTYHIIAAYYVNTKPEDDNGYVFPYNCYGNFTSKSYNHYQDAIKRRSLYTTGYTISKDDYCMTLSVPTDIMPDFRFVVVGVRTDEVKKITETKENKMLHYPQAYCDKLGIRNIFKQFSKPWYPEIVTQSGDKIQLSEKDFS